MFLMDDVGGDHISLMTSTNILLIERDGKVNGVDFCFEGTLVDKIYEDSYGVLILDLDCGGSVLVGNNFLLHTTCPLCFNLTVSIVPAFSQLDIIPYALCFLLAAFLCMDN